MKNKKGFTLIELLVVIGILAILFAITLIAINPSRQFGQANNTRRRSETLQLLNTIHQYVAENKGVLPSEILALDVGVATMIQKPGGVDLCAKIMPNYIPALPTEPSLNTTSITDCTAEAYNTGYRVKRDAQNRITVDSPVTDNGEIISVTR
jgi:type IV pilus assembly protein PilA